MAGPFAVEEIWHKFLCLLIPDYNQIQCTLAPNDPF